ncbi:hypothetical protein N7474_004194 [Penicillium riverlandense]|uniref:uncharacterized protein n=1 Tax=Penicillium riverlandense TaxID=1903569 RepID=UPI0025470163|nr:uncharacterized protein N7474_004194 [Penicillium riverlandense]KAJ5818603.1 hypothetical protein N7474_004194 [Penicillium riverlandense]
MGIPGLINAIGSGERISLSKLAITHLERTARPIRVAVDISIWLFQVQAGRGGKNPELRTLFYRLLKFLSLPIHPLFVYDGPHKPPFKRGKAVSARSYGNAPIIRRSKDLIERFKFPWHDAPGEAEAECARLQRAGIVDAVMSNDVDTLMFGSSLTIMNFSKESGSGTSASTHVTCYGMGKEGYPSNVPLDRAGMILFAMLSGGDYLPSGVPKCGSKLAAEIAKAGFGEDLLQEITSHGADLSLRLNEWRERLQYELEENESGYFATKHKAVRIPETFPDQTILEFYAEPKVSGEEEMASLKRKLRHAWDREINPWDIRVFAADNFEWNYRSGARKIIKLLAEPLVSYRLRLQRPVSTLAPGQSLAPDCDIPMLQKVYKSRVSFGTDGMTELQLDMLPIDVVGLDLFAEEPNPPLQSQETLPSQSTVHSGDEEEDVEMPPPQTPTKSRVTKRFDPCASEKVWVFDTVARLGLPEVVKKWEKEEAEKAQKAASPKRRRPVDVQGPGRRDPSIRECSEEAHLPDAAASTSSTKHNLSRPQRPYSPPEFGDEDTFAPTMYSFQEPTSEVCYSSREVNEVLSTFSGLPIMSPTPGVKRHPMTNQSRVRTRRGILGGGGVDLEELDTPITGSDVCPSQTALPQWIKMSYSVSQPQETGKAILKTPVRSTLTGHRPREKKQGCPDREESVQVEESQEAVDSLYLSPSKQHIRHKSPVRRSSPKKVRTPDILVPSPRNQTADFLPPERPTRLADQSCASGARTLVTTAQRQLPCEHITPSSNKSCKTNRKKASTPKPKTTSKRANDHSELQTIGHVENITTQDGFWTVEAAGSEVAAECSSGGDQAIQSKNGKEGKKRIPRVSILDLI